MSQGARMFFVGSIMITGITVLAVNYYTDQEKQVTQISIEYYFFQKKSFFLRENE